MRFFSLVKGDVRFAHKHGFYLLYVIFCALYALVLYAVPSSARPVLSTALIFTDPAATGIFFMGAIVLLEKSQRVNCALAVSPVRVWEYVASKTLSMSLISLLAGFVIAWVGEIRSMAQCLLGVFLGSCLFSLCGLIVAMRVTTLNGFIVFTVPFELFICAPPILMLFGIEHPALMLHPGAACVWLINGTAPSVPLCALSLAAWTALAFVLCCKTVRRNFLTMGGAAI